MAGSEEGKSRAWRRVVKEEVGDKGHEAVKAAAAASAVVRDWIGLDAGRLLCVAGPVKVGTLVKVPGGCGRGWVRGGRA